MISTLTSTPSIWFTIPAMVGTLFFAIRLVMAMVGIDLGDGDEGGLFEDVSVDEGMDHAESTSVFKFISIQTLTSFAMGFGLGGLAALHTLQLDLAPSIVVAIGSGAAFAWFIIWLLGMLYKMESSGNISIRETIGCAGVTTSAVPEAGAGTGRVRVTVQDRQRPFAARSDSSEIRMGAQVRVVAVNEDNSVTVTTV